MAARQLSCEDCRDCKGVVWLVCVVFSVVWE